MRTLVKWILVSVISATCGGIVAWHICLRQIHARIIPFDRSRFDHVLYEWIFSEPQIKFDFNTTNNVYWQSNPDKKKLIDPNLVTDLKRWSGIDTNMPFIVSFNPDVTIRQVAEINTMFCQAGFPPLKILVEERRDNKKGRKFKELKLGSNAAFEWYLKEWLVESAQEQACKSMTNATKKLHK